MDGIKNKQIEGYEDYIIYEDGKVWSKKTNRFLKISSDGKYNQVNLSKNGKPKMFKLHRLLGLHFIPNPDNMSEVDHIDRDKLNNNLSNLRWATRQQQQLNQNIRTNNKSGVKGVQFDKYSYRATWNVDKKQKRKIFSIKKYGDVAFNLAVECRKEMEEKHYKNIL